MNNVVAYMKDINETKSELTDNPDFFRYLNEYVGNHPAIKLNLEDNLTKNSIRRIAS